jgi:DNA polymerase (family X)
MNNPDIARKLNEYADYLEGEEPNIHRVRAYRRAAQTIRELERPASDILAEQGRAGLDALPGVGASLAYTIESLIRTGEFRTLRPAGGHIDPERLLTSLPGVGRQLARVLHERFGVSTLEQMEMAAHDGRLSQAGVGPKRLRGVPGPLPASSPRERRGRRGRRPPVRPA